MAERSRGTADGINGDWSRVEILCRIYASRHLDDARNLAQVHKRTSQRTRDGPGNFQQARARPQTCWVG